MGKIIDRTGIRYGRLIAIKMISNTKPIYWLCKCDCGNYDNVSSSNLASGAVKSCGCLNKEIITKHGLQSSKLYQVHNSMKQRCFNKKDKGYKNYGGRGIIVCNEWSDKEKGFINFYNWAVKNGYQEGLTIDRIDVNGNYEPSNCRWVTQQKQQLNKRTNRFLKYNGEIKTIKEWSEELNISYKILQYKSKQGLTIQEILKEQEKNNLKKYFKKVTLYYKDTGKKFKDFENVYQACMELGLKRTQTSSAYKALYGQRSSSYGYIWRFTNEYTP